MVSRRPGIHTDYTALSGMQGEPYSKGKPFTTHVPSGALRRARPTKAGLHNEG